MSERSGLGLLVADPEHLGDLGGVGNKVGGRRMCWHDPTETCARDVAAGIVDLIVSGQIAGETIREDETKWVVGSVGHGVVIHILFLSARSDADMFAW